MRAFRLLTTIALGLTAFAVACTPAAEPTTAPTATKAAAATATTGAQSTATTAATATTGAVATATQPAAVPATATATRLPATATTITKVGRLFALVNPNRIVEINPDNNQVVATHTIDIPGGGRWADNDDNNYFDGANIWLLTRNSNAPADDLGVIALNLDTMKLTMPWVKVGQGNFNSFVGRATKDGILPIGLRDLGQVATFDAKTFKLLWIKDVPLGVGADGKTLLYKKDYPNPADTTGSQGAVVCDMDVTIVNGKEVGVYPTQGTELVFAIDVKDGSYVAHSSIAKGSRGNMLSTSPSNGYIWAQENGTNSQAVIDPKTMQVIGRVPTPFSPSRNTFSPDGKYTYINGSGNSTVVADTTTFKVVATPVVGAGAGKSAVHPNGKVLYTQSSQELKVAVIETTNWTVTANVTLPAAPSGLFFQNVAR